MALRRGRLPSTIGDLRPTFPVLARFDSIWEVLPEPRLLGMAVRDECPESCGICAERLREFRSQCTLLSRDVLVAADASRETLEVQSLRFALPDGAVASGPTAHVAAVADRLRGCGGERQARGGGRGGGRRALLPGGGLARQRRSTPPGSGCARVACKRAHCSRAGGGAR